MNPTESAPVASGPPVAPAVFPPAVSAPQRTEDSSTLPKASPRHSGYGLPCAKCRTYYAADLAACPVCQSPERVSPVAAFADALGSVVEESPNAVALEEERERFLREFKSQAYAGSMQLDPASSFRCAREEDHQGASEPAAVCQHCYNSLRERADLAEAALHIDVNEATQIIYDAVWSDPSNPTKTYQNAAQALLNELRRRAGISAVLGPLQTLTD
jgi:hypothetical protein